MARSLAFGVGSAAILIWLTFFAAAGAVEIATLAAVVVALLWFVTVDPARLTDEGGRPHLMLFGLATLGCALLVTAAALISSATTFLMLAVGAAAIVIGLVRAVRYGIEPPPENL